MGRIIRMMVTITGETFWRRTSIQVSLWQSQQSGLWCGSADVWRWPLPPRAALTGTQTWVWVSCQTSGLGLWWHLCRWFWCPSCQGCRFVSNWARAVFAPPDVWCCWPSHTYQTSLVNTFSEHFIREACRPKNLLNTLVENTSTLNMQFSSSAPGGTRIDEGDKTKVTVYCVFTTEESHAALRLYAQVHPRSPSHSLCPPTKILYHFT